MKIKASPKKVLRKISKEKSLNNEEKQVVDDLIAVLKRALKGKSLKAADRKLIKQTIHQSEAGLLTGENIVSAARGIFGLVDIFKDYS